MKKIIVILLVCIFCLVNVISVNAATEKSRADILNSLSLLQGNGIDYNLDGQLKRSEAVTFIVRVLGKETYVNDNKAKYQTTTFIDVKSDDWYAAYVGFCVEQNIVSGFPDGKFHPDELVTEKAFLKMLLGVLGYIEGNDFSWDNVLIFAFNVGLVDDPNYKISVNDNANYKRLDVVNALYNSLTKPYKDKNQTIINNLIKQNVVKRSLALQLGLVKDEVPTKIEKSSVTNENSITIKLNEEIKPISSNAITLNESGTNVTLETSIESQKGTELLIKTSQQKPAQQYTLELKNLEDMDGNITTALTTDFIGYRPTLVTSTAVSNENQLKIELSQEVRDITSEKIVIYEKENKEHKLTANIESNSGKTLVISTSTQRSDQKYVVEINSVGDIQGNTISINSEFVGYKVPEVKSDFFKISKVVPVSNKVIKIYFTQPIFANIELPYYYEINKNGSNFVKGNNSNITVKTVSAEENAVYLSLKNETFNQSDKYTLTMSGDMVSLYGVALNFGQGESIDFHGVNQGQLPFGLLSAAPIDSKTIKLEFNQEIDRLTGQDITNYSLTNSSGAPIFVTRAVISNDANNKGKVVLLNVTGLDKNSNYELKVTKISDKLNIYTMPDTKFPILGQSILDRKDIQLLLVQQVDNSTLNVYFDRNLDFGAATNSNNYAICDSAGNILYSPIKAYFDTKNSNRVTLFLPPASLTASSTYKVRLLSMIDESGILYSNSSELSFLANNNATLKPRITEARIIGKDIIRVTTDKELLDQNPNLSTANYSLEYQEGNSTTVQVPTSVVYIDARTLSLKFASLELTKPYNLKFTSLTDFSGLNVRSSTDGLTSVNVTLGK